jgi:electron transfer flavoprotein beta subunit
VKIAVCIKRTPDSETRFRIAASKSAIDETGVKFDMDDFASYAVEVALQMKEKAGSGEVVVIALGPDSVQETLRKAMSMGADRGIQLKTDGMSFDGLAIAKALGAEIKSGSFDLVLFGKHAFDTSEGVVGTATAELLDLPCVTAASKLEIANGKGSARRELEGAAELVEFSLPAVVTIDEGIAAIRRSRGSWRRKKSRSSPNRRNLLPRASRSRAWRFHPIVRQAASSAKGRPPSRSSSGSCRLKPKCSEAPNEWRIFSFLRKHVVENCAKWPARRCRWGVV